jgi:hypothetical protein
MTEPVKLSTEAKRLEKLCYGRERARNLEILVPVHDVLEIRGRMRRGCGGEAHVDRVKVLQGLPPNGELRRRVSPVARRSAHGASINDSSLLRPAGRHNAFFRRTPSLRATTWS